MLIYQSIWESKAAQTLSFLLLPASGTGGAEGSSRRGALNLRVGVAQTASPALNGDDGAAVLQYTQPLGLVHTPLQPLVDILLPDNIVEVGLLLGVVEGIHATGQVRVAGSSSGAGDHDDRTSGTVLGDETSSHATICTRLSAMQLVMRRGK